MVNGQLTLLAKCYKWKGTFWSQRNNITVTISRVVLGKKLSSRVKLSSRLLPLFTYLTKLSWKHPQMWFRMVYVFIWKKDQFCCGNTVQSMGSQQQKKPPNPIGIGVYSAKLMFGERSIPVDQKASFIWLMLPRTLQEIEITFWNYYRLWVKQFCFSVLYLS